MFFPRQRILLDAYARRHEGQKILLRQAAAQRWVEYRDQILQGQRPHPGNHVQLQAIDNQLRAVSLHPDLFFFLLFLVQLDQALFFLTPATEWEVDHTASVPTRYLSGKPCLTDICTDKVVEFETVVLTCVCVCVLRKWPQLVTNMCTPSCWRRTNHRGAGRWKIPACTESSAGFSLDEDDELRVDDRTKGDDESEATYLRHHRHQDQQQQFFSPWYSAPGGPPPSLDTNISYFFLEQASCSDYYKTFSLYMDFFLPLFFSWIYDLGVWVWMTGSSKAQGRGIPIIFLGYFSSRGFLGVFFLTLLAGIACCCRLRDKKQVFQGHNWGILYGP